jgi:glucose/arabinose dehydrogenase
MGVVRRHCAVEPLEARVLLTVIPSGFAESKVVDKLFSPTGMEVTPDGRIFALEQSGGVRVIKDGQLLATPFVTVPTEFKNERGLVGITFDPDFTSNGHVYLYWTDPSPKAHNVVSRFTATGDVAAPGSRVDLIKLPDLNTPFHIGGAMRFGPDGKLYVAVGENSTPENSQRLSNPLGKILRFNRDGTIPADNPFYNQASGQGKAIWAYGLRNPFSFNIQQGTGRMLINDVGQDTWEEVNVGQAGANYGWPASEGPTTDSRFKAPLYAYKHTSRDSDGASIVGAAFYNAPAGGWDASAKVFPTSYAGRFFFADLTGGFVKVLDPETGDVEETFATNLARPVDVDVSPDGSVYVLARGVSGGREGRVLKYTRTGA